MRLAAIDLGSNTVHLLVADAGPGGSPWRVVESDQHVTRLGEGLAASGRLGVAPTVRTAAAVVAYVARARAAGAERVAIVATSAVREAANRSDFVAMLERAAGERVRVVTGEEEAALTLAGVLHGLGESAGRDHADVRHRRREHRVRPGPGRRGGGGGQPSPRRRRSRRASSVPRARGLDPLPGALRRDRGPACARAAGANRNRPAAPDRRHGRHRDCACRAGPRSRPLRSRARAGAQTGARRRRATARASRRPDRRRARGRCRVWSPRAPTSSCPARPWSWPRSMSSRPASSWSAMPGCARGWCWGYATSERRTARSCWRFRRAAASEI